MPLIGFIALIKGQQFDMAMTPVQTAMIVITLLVASLNLSDGKSNAIEGMIHFVLLLTFIMLAFIGY